MRQMFVWASVLAARSDHGAGIKLSSVCVCVCAQAIWKLTDKQTQDLLHARRLLVTRRCVLSTERRIITNQLADNDANTSHPLDSIVTIEHLTAALRRNAAENHELYYRVARGVYCGVCESPDCDRHILSFALGLANVCQKWSMQRRPNNLHLCMHTLPCVVLFATHTAFNADLSRPSLQV